MWGGVYKINNYYYGLALVFDDQVGSFSNNHGNSHGSAYG